jgi:hypothetical protein
MAIARRPLFEANAAHLQIWREAVHRALKAPSRGDSGDEQRELLVCKLYMAVLAPARVTCDP